MTFDYHTLADPADFCRECGGKGMVTYRDHSRGVNVTETCDRCGGHKRHTIRIRRKDDDQNNRV